MTTETNSNQAKAGASLRAIELIGEGMSRCPADQREDFILALATLAIALLRGSFDKELTEGYLIAARTDELKLVITTAAPTTY